MDDLVTTSEAAEIAGVGVSSIKRWADQQRIRVVRTPGGHRRVDRADLLRFLQTMRSSAGGYEIAGPGRARYRGAGDGLSSPTSLRPGGTGGEEADAGEYWADAMLKADVYELQATLLSARSRHGSWSAVSDEAIRGLGVIGMRWAQGTLTVMEEHVASERLSRALSAIVATMPRSPLDPTCMLASVGGDRHTLGLSFLQLCLRESGWQSLWVGASTPTEDLISTAASGRMDMIALSATRAAPRANELPALAQAVGKACHRSGTKLVLGGSGPWPDATVHGTRFHSFADFSSYLEEIA
ncbi:MAG: helix-turn-helix domain-containing protein [Rhodothermales bacterium]|nr:helix-turn-helix domain-containing protein [Rhodothermales bacterium]